jgi:GNAT superfamily N-acetyltransferase
MKTEITFKSYSNDYKTTCLGLFDANCPEFFAPNERADYSSFLEKSPVGYEVCLVEDAIAGAFGLIGDSAPRGRLNWIMLNPRFQGRGAGRAIMERVVARASSAGILAIDIAASQKSAPFFARFGAVTLNVIENGWGVGMHRVDMELPLRRDSSLRRARGQ